MGYAVGPTTLRWVRSKMPIGQLNVVSRDGCVDGCASTMKSAAAAVIGLRISTCMISWVCSASDTLCTTFRGRTLERLVREPSAGNPLARFDEAGCGNGVMEPRLRHRQPKGAATVERNLPPPRHISTLRRAARYSEPPPMSRWTVANVTILESRKMRSKA